MAGETGNNQLRTALVVLATPADPLAGPGGYTVANGPPTLTSGPEMVRKWFSSKGFDVDPVVGIAFSISGPGNLFNRTFGPMDPESTLEYNQAALAGRLDKDLLRYVAAVVVGPPPDFGPGNP
jgi:hypothetical protein